MQDILRWCLAWKSSDSAAVATDGQVCFTFSIRPSVDGAMSMRGTVSGELSTRGTVAGSLTIAEC